MAFDTRADLASAITTWLNRSDLAARIPDFIRLAESRLNRLLRDPDQLTSTTLAFTAGASAIPADFGQLVAFGPAGRRLQPLTPGEFGTINPQAGEPQVYVVGAGTISVMPTASGAIPITYYRAIPALTSDTSTNWLLKRAPDIYLHGALLQAEFYGWNDDRLPLIKSAWDEGIMELRIDGENRRWGAAPLAPRVRRT